MTQPIQEPTTQRSITQGKWNENQLYRRPQVAPDCCDYPYVFRLNDEGQNITSGANEYISFNVDDFEQAPIEWFQADSPTTVNLRGQAVYDFFAGYHWVDPFNSKCWITIECQQFEYMPTNMGWGGLYTDGGTLIDQDRMTFIHFQARMLGDPTGQEIAVQIGHGNGSSQDMESAFLRIAKVADWTSGTGAAINGDGLLF